MQEVSMKKSYRLALVAAALGLAALIALRPSTGAVIAAETVSPRSLYAVNCAGCHGRTGQPTDKGAALDAPDLRGFSKSSASIARTIKNGRGDMPSFGKKLRASQIASIAGYVKSL
jgi:mono/diheme cytochrome c family protein